MDLSRSLTSRPLLTALLAAIVLAGMASPVHAVPITFEFTGINNGNDTDSPDGAVGLLLPVGTTIVGSVTYESTIPDNGTGTYFGAIDATSFVVDGGTYVGSAPSGTLSHGFNFFSTDVRPGDGLVAADVGANQLILFSLSVSSTDIVSTAVPTTPPPVTPMDNFGANSDRITLLFEDAGANVSGVAFQLTSLTQVVPEPTTATLIGLGLLALCTGDRRTVGRLRNG